MGVLRPGGKPGQEFPFSPHRLRAKWREHKIFNNIHNKELKGMKRKKEDRNKPLGR